MGLLEITQEQLEFSLPFCVVDKWGLIVSAVPENSASIWVFSN